MPELEIIPAVLVKTREDLLSQIEQVMPYVKNVQIDIMDGKFVPNKTIGLDELADLPMGVGYEFHWMAYNPEQWIEQVPGPHLHLVHVESMGPFSHLSETVKKVGGRLGLAFNPETPLDRIHPYQKQVERIMAMTVHPGFSGQKYIPGVEANIRELRKENPVLDIEVDGGINRETIQGAVKAGANKIGAASAIFASTDIQQAIKELEEAARIAASQRERAWATG
ncbi:MAG TPA: ribulose-phosphate 3-epimerase [Candidatus Bilamarchaeaceae archaeon]|nr:ribulose-phosphate 3-epimerase [Candidatus Bilamarchaeaceae archaeon]